jgi:dinuclear metal center YbgI/SA1388 family protein
VFATEIISELDRLLVSRDFHDYGPNGLQVPGRAEVETIATSVSATVDAIERAIAQGADLILVHHGLFWDGMPRSIDAALHRRLKPLFAHDVGLAAYHLPLDGHPEHGNNALLAAGLGCARTEPFAEHKGMAIGVAGHFDAPVDAGELAERVRTLTAREPLHLAFGPGGVRSIGLVSGAGSSYLPAAIAAGFDAFLTGEPSERDMAVAREGGVHFFAAGHYATETFGIRRLGDLLAERHGLRHVFVDDPNPI